MGQAVDKNRVPEIVWLWLLLLAALACLGVGLYRSWHYLTALGVVIFAAYAYLNGQPAHRRLFADRVNPSNPATGLPLMRGTHTDCAGHYYGSTER